MGALSCPPWVPHPWRGPSPPARKGLVPPLAPTCHPLLAPLQPRGARSRARTLLCFLFCLLQFENKSLWIRLASDPSPRRAEGTPPHVPASPPTPPSRQQPPRESLYLLTYISTPPLQNLCFPKNSYTVWEGGAKRGEKQGGGNGDGVSPAPGGLLARRGSPQPCSALGWGHRRLQPHLGRVTLLPYSFIIIIIIIPFFFFLNSCKVLGRGGQKENGAPIPQPGTTGVSRIPPQDGELGWGGAYEGFTGQGGAGGRGLTRLLPTTYKRERDGGGCKRHPGVLWGGPPGSHPAGSQRGGGPGHGRSHPAPAGPPGCAGPTGRPRSSPPPRAAGPCPST